MSPEAKARDLAQVLVADVETADESNLTIHDKDLAVVTKVDLHAPAEGIDRHKWQGAAPGGHQVDEKAVLQVVGTHGIVEQADLHAFLGLVGENVEELTADLVVLENEGLQMDVVAGAVDRGQHGIKSRPALVVDSTRLPTVRG